MAVSGGLPVIWKEVIVIIQLNNEEAWVMVLVIQMERRGWMWVIWKVELLSLGNWYEREREMACNPTKSIHCCAVSCTCQRIFSSIIQNLKEPNLASDFLLLKWNYPPKNKETQWVEISINSSAGTC